MAVALDEHDNKDLLEEVDGMAFLADQEIRNLIESRGGVRMDFVESFFGSRLDVRLTGAYGCSC